MVCRTFPIARCGGRATSPVLAAAAVACAVALLLLGLTPDSFRRPNDAEWTAAGLRFRGEGIAHTRPVHLPRVESFSVHLAFSPAAQPAEGYSFLLSLHDGDDDDQLMIGQWRSSVIILNGEPAGERRDAGLTLPSASRTGTRLLLGNSPSVKNGWSGTIASVAVRSAATSAEEAAELHEAWVAGGGFSLPSEDLLFSIDTFGPSRPALEIPDHLRVLRRRFLKTGISSSFSRRALAYDVAINFIGFVPFGAVVYGLLYSTRRRNGSDQSRTRTKRRQWPMILIAIAAGVGIAALRLVPSPRRR